jgi:hypothetical protein
LDKPKTPRGGRAIGLPISLANRCQLRRYLKPLSGCRRVFSDPDETKIDHSRKIYGRKRNCLNARTF